MGSKIQQVGLENPPSWGPKSTKLGSKINKNQSWEGLGAILTHLGPKRHQDPFKELPEKIKRKLGRVILRVLGPKIDQKPITSQLKNQSIFKYMLRSIFLGFWHQLGFQNPPKIEQSWDQVAP